MNMKSLFDAFEYWLQGLVNTCVSGLDSRLKALEEARADSVDDAIRVLQEKVRAQENAMALLCQHTLPAMEDRIVRLGDRTFDENDVDEIWDQIRRRVRDQIEDSLDRYNALDAITDDQRWDSAIADAVREALTEVEFKVTVS